MTATLNTAAEINALDTAKVGDWATHTIYSDAKPGQIIRRTPKRIVWQAAKMTHLNPPGSAAPDAMHFQPGGFCGHWSGRQRWEVTPDAEGEILVFTLRAGKNGQPNKWKLAGHPSRSPGHILRDGCHPYYDFNF